jgi:hypothetical protein
MRFDRQHGCSRRCSHGRSSRANARSAPPLWLCATGAWYAKAGRQRAAGASPGYIHTEAVRRLARAAGRTPVGRQPLAPTPALQAFGHCFLHLGTCSSRHALHTTVAGVSHSGWWLQRRGSEVAAGVPHRRCRAPPPPPAASSLPADWLLTAPRILRCTGCPVSLRARTSPALGAVGTDDGGAAGCQWGASLGAHMPCAYAPR